MNKDRVGEPQPLERLPGLFRHWEFAKVIESGMIYLFEDAGAKADGTILFEIYVGAYRDPKADIPPWIMR